MDIAILLNDKLGKEELAVRFPHHQGLLPLLKKLPRCYDHVKEGCFEELRQTIDKLDDMTVALRMEHVFARITRFHVAGSARSCIWTYTSKIKEEHSC